MIMIYIVAKKFHYASSPVRPSHKRTWSSPLRELGVYGQRIMMTKKTVPLHVVYIILEKNKK